MALKSNQSALFIMPRSSGAWKGSEALWITVAGWSAAAQRRFGSAFVLTKDRIATYEEVLSYPISKKPTNKPQKSSLKQFVPTVISTLIKDILLYKRSRSKLNYNYNIPGNGNQIALIWEQHDLFPGIGYKLAKKFNAPYVVYVHAPQVWEASKWGVKRPGWGNLLERMETKSLKRADVVACVSIQVANKLKNMGISEDKILVSPMAVDPYLFTEVNSENIIEKLNLKNKFVIGWTGSFRSFHGLDILMQAFKKVHAEIENTCLMLVGDGAEKHKTMKIAEELGINSAVIFVGRKKFIEMPLYVNAFDIAIVSASNADDFHYSPLKLREYLAAGKPTLAPNAGEIPTMFMDDVHLKLYDVGNIEDIAQKIIEFYKSKNMRTLIANEGKKHILKNGTWDVELEKLMIKTN